MSESGQHRVVVVVVGVTPHQGDGSAVTGRRTTGNDVQARMSPEALDLMRDPLRALEHLGKLAAADPGKRFGKLYRLVYHQEGLQQAGEHGRQNTGGRTAGIDGQTRRHIDEGRLSRLAEERAHNRYQPQAVRRVYVPKGKAGGRALGIPSSRERIVQAVVAQVVEAGYEPIFRNGSYGFRPQRNTLQARRHVARAYQAGATGIIEGDLGKCFDTIPPGVILHCLRKRIKDERCIDRIRKMRTAGGMEDGHCMPTYSGTPQGGRASPILRNVVLPEFDCWLEEQWQANPPLLTKQQPYTRAHPEDVRPQRNLVRGRAQLHGRLPMGRQTPEGVRAKMPQTRIARKQVASVVPRRRISSGRFADDDGVVLWQHSKPEAQPRKTAMAQWLEEKLGLAQPPEKTHSTPWDQRCRVLGYDGRGRRHPNGTRWLRLSIPPEKERALKAQGKRVGRSTQMPELDLFMSVNALMRGWANYCRYANNAPQRCRDLTGVVYWLTVHSLGRQHRCAVQQVMRPHYGVAPASGKRALYPSSAEGKRVSIWKKLPPRKSLRSKVVGAKDIQPLP